MAEGSAAPGSFGFGHTITIGNAGRRNNIADDLLSIAWTNDYRS
jgi:hypothetical protein